MSLQYLSDPLDHSIYPHSKVQLKGTLQTKVSIKTCTSASDTEYGNSEGYSEKGSPIEMGMTPSRLLSQSSVGSFDNVEGSLFEIDVCPKKKRFANVEERRQFVEDYKKKYKTEMCKNWELRGHCKFGDKCCFAHGKNELKEKGVMHVHYKTKPCKEYHQKGYCPYGLRCQYLHREAVQPNVFMNPAKDVNGYTKLYETLYEVSNLCGADGPLKPVLDKLAKRTRLRVFKSCSYYNPNKKASGF